MQGGPGNKGGMCRVQRKNTVEQVNVFREAGGSNEQMDSMETESKRRLINALQKRQNIIKDIQLHSKNTFFNVPLPCKQFLYHQRDAVQL